MGDVVPRGEGAVHHAGVSSRREDVGAAALRRQAGAHRGHAGRRDGLLRGRRAVATHQASGPATDPAHYARGASRQALVPATPPGTSRRPPQPASGCSTQSGLAVSAAVQSQPLNRLAANLEELRLDGWPHPVPRLPSGWWPMEKDLVTRLYSSSQARRSRRSGAPTTAGASTQRTSYVKTRWPTSTGRSSPACRAGWRSSGSPRCSSSRRGDNVNSAGARASARPTCQWR